MVRTIPGMETARLATNVISSIEYRTKSCRFPRPSPARRWKANPMSHYDGGRWNKGWKVEQVCKHKSRSSLSLNTYQKPAALQYVACLQWTICCSVLQWPLWCKSTSSIATHPSKNKSHLNTKEWHCTNQQLNSTHNVLYTTQFLCGSSIDSN